MNRVVLSAIAAFFCFNNLANSIQAGPVPAGQASVKIEELEAAGQLIAQGKIDEAFKKIEEAVKKHPILPPARLILARFMIKFKHPQWRLYLEQAATDSPDHPDVYLTLGEVAFEEGRISDAILNSLRVLDLVNAPRWTAEQKTNFVKVARKILAASFESRHDWSNARVQLGAWLEMEPRNVVTRQRLAAALFNLNKPEEAFQEFQAAAKEDATTLSAAVLMARQYLGRGDFAKATEYFDQAVKAEPNNPRVHVAYANFLLGKSELEGAKIHTEAALKIDPKNTEARQMQGLLARFTRNYELATKIFEDIYRAEPANLLAADQLALVLIESSDDASKKRAVQLAETNARQYPNNIDVLGTLGYCYFRAGNTEQSKQTFARFAGKIHSTSSDMAYFIALLAADDPKGKDDVRQLLKEKLESKSLFFFRKEAQALYDKLATAK